jgi:hypothetical protein
MHLVTVHNEQVTKAVDDGVMADLSARRGHEVDPLSAEKGRKLP